MEIAIDDILPNMLRKYKDMCTCQRCIEDIKAIALNNLKPIYISTDKGNVYVKIHELEAQFMTDITKELTKAIEVVSKNPRHD